jgi:hypothetical protein
MKTKHVIVGANSRLQIVVFGPYPNERAAERARLALEVKYPSAGLFVTETVQPELDPNVKVDRRKRGNW